MPTAAVNQAEDAEFVMRWWADAQLLVVMLRRLRGPGKS